MHRRSVLASVVPAVAGSLAAPALATRQEPTALAGHPLVGAWLVVFPGQAAFPAVFHPDGTVLTAVPPSYVDPALGLTLQSPTIGVWTPVGDRGCRMVSVQALSDEAGNFIGTWANEVHPEVSADGQTFTDTTPQRIVVRDATNAIVSDQVAPVPPGSVLGIRIGIDLGALMVPVAEPTASTPTP